jgi:RNA polymerase sigma factor for flagellar operon FliA
MKNTAAKVTTDYKESNNRVVEHESLVKRIAFHLMSRLPASVQADDLIQAGMIGLI